MSLSFKPPTEPRRVVTDSFSLGGVVREAIHRNEGRVGYAGKATDAGRQAVEFGIINAIEGRSGEFDVRSMSPGPAAKRLRFLAIVATELADRLED
jgi:hypothetical protein